MLVINSPRCDPKGFLCQYPCKQGFPLGLAITSGYFLHNAVMSLWWGCDRGVLPGNYQICPKHLSLFCGLISTVNLGRGVWGELLIVLLHWVMSWFPCMYMYRLYVAYHVIHVTVVHVITWLLYPVQSWTTVHWGAYQPTRCVWNYSVQCYRLVATVFMYHSSFVCIRVYRGTGCSINTVIVSCWFWYTNCSCVDSMLLETSNCCVEHINYIMYSTAATNVPLPFGGKLFNAVWTSPDSCVLLLCVIN